MGVSKENRAAARKFGREASGYLASAEQRYKAEEFEAACLDCRFASESILLATYIEYRDDIPIEPVGEHMLDGAMGIIDQLEPFAVERMKDISKETAMMLHVRPTSEERYKRVRKRRAQTCLTATQQLVGWFSERGEPEAVLDETVPVMHPDWFARLYNETFKNDDEFRVASRVNDLLAAGKINQLARSKQGFIDPILTSGMAHVIESDTNMRQLRKMVKRPGVFRSNRRGESFLHDPSILIQAIVEILQKEGPRMKVNAITKRLSEASPNWRTYIASIAWKSTVAVPLEIMLNLRSPEMPNWPLPSQRLYFDEQANAITLLDEGT